MKRQLVILIGVGTLALFADACGGKTVTGGSSTGGSGGSGAGPVGGTGAAPYGGYGGAPGGYGGMPVGGYGGMPAGGYGGMPVGGYGGYGGGPVGGYGGMPAGGYGGGPPCVGCKDYKIAGLISMKACCGPSGACGGLVDATIASLMGIPPGCYEIGQPGSPDPTCPVWQVPNPLDGGVNTFPGCCRPQSGTCGYYVDISNLSGPNFGCMDSGPITGVPPQYCGGSGDCGTCVQQKCSSELSMCLSNSDCSSIINCMQNCVDQQCANKCYQSWPNGQKMFDQIQFCVSAQCGVECQ